MILHVNIILMFEKRYAQATAEHLPSFRLVLFIYEEKNDLVPYRVPDLLKSNIIILNKAKIKKVYTFICVDTYTLHYFIAFPSVMSNRGG